MAVKISAVGHFIPDTILTSEQLEQIVFSKNPHMRAINGIIKSLTGIASRPVAEENQYSSTMAIKAADDLFSKYKIDKNSIDLLIFASATQDLIEPATSHIIQNELGLESNCFDIKNACNSFLNGLEVASSLIESRVYNRVLVVTGEKPSVSLKLNLKDREDFKKSFAGLTFGDSGAAVLLEKSNNDSKIIFQNFTTSSKHWEAGTLPGGGTRHPRGDEYSYFEGGGFELRNAFTQLGTGFLHDSLANSGLKYDDFKQIFIHQVSEQFLKEFIQVTGIPKDIVFRTVHKFGNLAAATLPVSLSLALEEERVKEGDKILFIGLAGGISLGVMAIQI